MNKSIIKVVIILGLVLANCLPVTATIDNNKKTGTGITPFWSKEHVISIWMPKVYVRESGDREAYEPGEYVFKIFAFPRGFSWTTDIYEVGDEHPEDPYNFGKLCTISGVKFTPQIIIFIAIELDLKEDLNMNELMGFKIYTFKPPRGDYPNNDPYQTEDMVWQTSYFTAHWAISFHY